MKRKTFKDFYYIIKDEDQKKYNCFVPNFSSHQWNLKVIEAQNKGRNISASQVPIEKVQDPSSFLTGYIYTNKLLVEEALDASKEYNKQLPSYAKNADKNKIIIINCCYCKGKYGELNTSFPGLNELKEAKEGIYMATCLKCGETVSDNYNWYRV